MRVSSYAGGPCRAEGEASALSTGNHNHFLETYRQMFPCATPWAKQYLWGLAQHVKFES